MSTCLPVPLRTRLFHTTEARLRAAGRAGIDHQFRGPVFGDYDLSLLYEDGAHDVEQSYVQNSPWYGAEDDGEKYDRDTLVGPHGEIKYAGGARTFCANEIEVFAV